MARVSRAGPAELRETILDGKYRIQGVAGRGGQAIVYRAQHLGFDAPVAVKVLKTRLDCDSSQRQAVSARFRDEAKILATLSSLHPAFVHAKDVGCVLDSSGLVVPYLVLEWLDGVSLDFELKQRALRQWPALDLHAVVRLLDAPAAALALAHRRGISHRDLKPGNLFLVRRDAAVSAKVLDFGLGKVIEDGLSTTEMLAQTSSRTHAFTPAYAAPEQWLGRLGASGPWTDVHAFALVAVELLRGGPALEGADHGQLMGACLDSTARPTPRRRGIELPDHVERVFERALAVDPRERYRDLSYFWTELLEAVGPIPKASLPPSLFAAFDGAALPALSAPESQHSAPPMSTEHDPGVPQMGRTRAQRTRRVASGGIAMALSVGLWFWNHDRASKHSGDAPAVRPPELATRTVSPPVTPVSTPSPSSASRARASSENAAPLPAGRERPRPVVLRHARPRPAPTQNPAVTRAAEPARTSGPGALGSAEPASTAARPKPTTPPASVTKPDAADPAHLVERDELTDRR